MVSEKHCLGIIDTQTDGMPSSIFLRNSNAGNDDPFYISVIIKIYDLRTKILKHFCGIGVWAAIIKKKFYNAFFNRSLTLRETFFNESGIL